MDSFFKTQTGEKRGGVGHCVGAGVCAGTHTHTSEDTGEQLCVMCGHTKCRMFVEL